MILVDTNLSFGEQNAKWRSKCKHKEKGSTFFSLYPRDEHEEGDFEKHNHYKMS